MNKCFSSASLLVLTILVSLVLLGCKANDAMDSTIAVSGKIDQTNTKIDETNQAVVDTNVQIAKTNNSIHLQTLYFAIKDMRDEDNWSLLKPSYLILAAAKTFGKEATAQEMADLAKVFKRTTEASLDEFAGDNPLCLPYVTKKGAILKAIEAIETKRDATTGNLTVEDQKIEDALASQMNDYYTPCAFAYNRNKLATIAAVQAVYGLAPQEKIEQIVKDQIFAGGAEMKYAYFGLSSRYYFLTEVRFAKEISAPLASKLEASPGLFNLGIEVLKQVDYILSLNVMTEINNFRFGFEALTIDGSINQYENVSIKATGVSTLPLWTDLTNKVKNLGPKFSDQSEKIQSDIKAGIETYNVVSVSSVLK